MNGFRYSDHLTEDESCAIEGLGRSQPITATDRKRMLTVKVDTTELEAAIERVRVLRAIESRRHVVPAIIGVVAAVEILAFAAMAARLI